MEDLIYINNEKESDKTVKEGELIRAYLIQIRLHNIFDALATLKTWL